MATRKKTTMSKLLKYAKYLDDLSKRRLDFGEAVNNKETKGHSDLLKLRSYLNDAEKRLFDREKQDALHQYMNVIMSQFKGKDISFNDFKSAVSNMKSGGQNNDSDTDVSGDNDSDDSGKNNVDFNKIVKHQESDPNTSGL